MGKAHCIYTGERSNINPFVTFDHRSHVIVANWPSVTLDRRINELLVAALLAPGFDKVSNYYSRAFTINQHLLISYYGPLLLYKWMWEFLVDRPESFNVVTPSSSFCYSASVPSLTFLLLSSQAVRGEMLRAKPTILEQRHRSLDDDCGDWLWWKWEWKKLSRESAFSPAYLC